jgi:hypothetical protein
VTTNESVRERLLRAAWREIRALDERNVANIPAARRCIEAGASPEELVRAMTAASYESVFRLLFLLSAEHAEEGGEEAQTGWKIVEAGLEGFGQPSRVSGSDLDFLHEDLLTADPTGAEGEDLFA